jgi:hypothetical protein
MIGRSQDNVPEEDQRGEPRDVPRQDAADVDGSRATISSVGQRVESVLEAAERAATDIRSDAEKWAQRHMEETRRRADELAAQKVQDLASITDDLLARAQAIARQSDELINALDAAGRRALRRESGPAGSPVAVTPGEKQSSKLGGRSPAGHTSEGAQSRVAGRDGLSSFLAGHERCGGGVDIQRREGSDGSIVRIICGGCGEAIEYPSVARH